MIFPWNLRKSSNEKYGSHQWDSSFRMWNPMKSHRNTRPGNVCIAMERSTMLLMGVNPLFRLGHFKCFFFNLYQRVISMMFPRWDESHRADLSRLQGPWAEEPWCGKRTAALCGPLLRAALRLCVDLFFSIPQLLRESLVLFCNLCGSTLKKTSNQNPGSPASKCPNEWRKSGDHWW